MDHEKTALYDAKCIREKEIENMLMDVYDSLEERGYQPYSQIVGFLLSGDPGYISNHKEARSKIVKFDRAEIIEVIVREYLNKKIWEY